ncbi:MAG TPA: hypothetical protein VK196_16990 [Magnetospirillum sp.]|nr:hypothetical protein [Magnetospirillum sp.]
MTWDTVQQFIRIIMQVLAGMLVSRGLITAEMGVTLTGAIVSLGGIAWWIFWQRSKPAA